MKDRKVLVAFDGTWWSGRNERSGPYQIIEETDLESEDITIYVAGIGNSVEYGTLGHWLGGGLAVGFGKRVRDTLEDIASRVQEGDRLEFHVFGASRGASQARNFVHRLNTKETKEGGLFEHNECRVAFLGAFDTVPAVGLPWINLMEKYLYPMDDGSGAEKSIHIVSEGDRKVGFAPTLMPNATLEVWVPGTHGEACGIGEVGEVYTRYVKKAWCMSCPNIDTGCEDADSGPEIQDVPLTTPNGKWIRRKRKMVEGANIAFVPWYGRFYDKNSPDFDAEKLRYDRRRVEFCNVLTQQWELSQFVEEFFGSGSSLSQYELT